MQSVRQPTFGRGIQVSLAVAAGSFALAIMANGSGHANATKILYWGLAVILIAVAGFGAQWAERHAASAAAAVGQTRPLSAMGTAWTVPSVAVFAAVALIATYHNLWVIAAGPLIAFIGTAGALLSRDLLDDAGDAALRTATAIHTGIIHAVAFFAFVAIAYNKLPVQLAAPLVALIGFALVLETLERGNLTPVRRVFFAALGALALGQAMLMLDWWQTHGWTGGAVLLVAFYLVAGVLLARAQRAAVRSRDLVEFGLVSAIAFLILAVTA